ncbi:unnamed protein product [Tetraodon nigroviridis]|uniref:(spotted green pufferfish) hypothetical protein n=1 Tax=Tetraodon nigroviridis TaxID=99883 RepID=Q4SGB2_TETNG|nr:unnamed protein product [Tetraodon nigroviridis]
MVWLQLWTMGLLAAMAISPAVTNVSGLLVVEEENTVPVRTTRRETQPLLSRQKRDWIWNSLYVEEEKPAPTAYKIGQLKSSKNLEGKRFVIEGEGANTIFIVDHKGDLFVTRALDREEKSSYHLTARMYDGNRNLVEDSGDFVVQVTDINDNSPVFAGTFNGSITERSMIGVISCKINTLDRETRSQYVVVVKAQDLRGLTSGSTATTSVTITITDTNDNIASFIRRSYELQVPENHKVNEKIGVLELEDRDQLQNKEPTFIIPNDISRVFGIELSPNKNGNLMLRKALDYETTNSYTFSIQVRENLKNLAFPADNVNSAVTTAQVNVKVLDVDEPPVFSQLIYSFTVEEERLASNFGTISARDPDRVNKGVRYSILDKDCPIGINPITGQLSTLRKLDRELEATHVFQVKAQEEPSGLESFVKVNVTVKDINDNKPELVVDEVSVCESDVAGTVIKACYD